MENRTLLSLVVTVERNARQNGVRLVSTKFFFAFGEQALAPVVQLCGIFLFVRLGFGQLKFEMNGGRSRTFVRHARQTEQRDAREESRSTHFRDAAERSDRRQRTRRVDLRFRRRFALRTRLPLVFGELRLPQFHHGRSGGVADQIGPVRMQLNDDFARQRNLHHLFFEVLVVVVVKRAFAREFGVEEKILVQLFDQRFGQNGQIHSSKKSFHPEAVDEPFDGRIPSRWSFARSARLVFGQGDFHEEQRPMKLVEIPFRSRKAFRIESLLKEKGILLHRFLREKSEREKRKSSVREGN